MTGRIEGSGAEPAACQPTHLLAGGAGPDGLTHADVLAATTDEITPIDAAQFGTNGRRPTRRSRLRDPPDVSPTSRWGVVATAGTQLRTSSSTGGCESVRAVFVETIRPHGVDSETEPLVETIRSELTDTIAIALAPRSKTTFSEDLKEGILAEAQARRIEAEITRRALDREAAFLEDATETIEEIETSFRLSTGVR